MAIWKELRTCGWLRQYQDMKKPRLLRGDLGLLGY
jgi:hypothetical protein